MKRKENTILSLLIVFSLLIRIYFMITIPAWQSPDEYSHYLNIENIADNNHLPSKTIAFPSYEAIQPPLYYIISSFIVNLYPRDITFSINLSYPPRKLIILRFLSVLAGVLFIYFSYRIYTNIPNIRSHDRLLSVAFLSMLPTFIGVTSTINNDAFVVLFSSISLMYILKPKWTSRTAIWSGFWAGIALLTKLSAVTLVPIFLFRVSQFKYVEKNLKIRWILLAISAWFFGAIILIFRNIIQFESVLALNPGIETNFVISLSHLIWAIRNLTWSFFFAFGRIYQVRPPPIIYIVTIIPLLILAIYGWIRVIKIHFKVFQLILVSIIFGVSSSLYYTFSYPRGIMTSWGKNLYPTLPLIAIFLVIGWNSIFKKPRVIISIITIVIMTLGCFWASLEFHKMLP